jgi:hypothetical protein
VNRAALNGVMSAPAKVGPVPVSDTLYGRRVRLDGRERLYFSCGVCVDSVALLRLYSSVTSRFP